VWGGDSQKKRKVVLMCIKKFSDQDKRKKKGGKKDYAITQIDAEKRGECKIQPEPAGASGERLVQAAAQNWEAASK